MLPAQALSKAGQLAQIQAENNRWHISGDMTIHQVRPLLASSEALSMQDGLQVDLANVSDVDTATIGILFEWLRRAQAQRCSIQFINFPANLTTLATLYGVLDILPQSAH